MKKVIRTDLKVRKILSFNINLIYKNYIKSLLTHCWDIYSDMISKEVWARIIKDFQERDLPEIIPREVAIPSEIPIKRSISIIEPRRAGKTYEMFYIIQLLLKKYEKIRYFTSILKTSNWKVLQQYKIWVKYNKSVFAAILVLMDSFLQRVSSQLRMDIK